MQIEAGGLTFEWIEGWAQIPDSESRRAGWAHHGVVVTEGQEVIAFHPGDPTVLVFDRDGHLLRSWETDLTEAHGMSLASHNGTEYLWIADPGAKRMAHLGYEYPSGPRKGRVVRMSLDGISVWDIPKPELGIYDEGEYSPTSVTINQGRFEGNGDIWAADGYGQSYVHRYSAEGEYVGSINGEEGEAGRFSCPHAVFVDTRKTEPELYIADRSNRRVQVYDLEGGFKRAFGSDFLTSPSAFALYGDLLLIAELRARLTVLDANDRLVGYLGENEATCDREGWPNARDASGNPVRPSDLEPGKFNSPHGVAVDQDGNIYVPEWLIGGRFTKLVRQ